VIVFQVGFTILQVAEHYSQTHVPIKNKALGNKILNKKEWQTFRPKWRR